MTHNQSSTESEQVCAQLLRTLTTWYCPHSHAVLLCAMQQAINFSCRPVHSSKVRCCDLDFQSLQAVVMRHAHKGLLVQNLLFIQHISLITIMFCFNKLALTVQVKHKINSTSTQILQMFVFYDWPFPHMCTLQRM